MEEMTSLERCLATIKYQPHDRVPVDLHNFMMTTRFLPEIEQPVFYRNGELMGAGQVAAWERFGHDMLLIENGTSALAQACGCEVDFPLDSAPRIEKPFLHDLSELDKLPKPNPLKSELCRATLDATKYIMGKIGDKAYIMGRADQGPFDLACLLVGTGNLLMDMAMGERDELIFQLLEYTSDAYIMYAGMFKELGCHGTSVGEAFCSPDVISPQMFKKYCLPYDKKVVEALQSDDFTMSYHTCGDTTKIIDMMVETGAKIIEFDYKCDLETAKKAAAAKTTLLGPIDPSGILHEGSVDDVDQAAIKTIKALAPGGGFILGPGCAMPGTTPFKNVDKLIETAKAYGRY